MARKKLKDKMGEEIKITSMYLKVALLSYWRFKKASLCADEVTVSGNCKADVLVDTGKEVIEIECKTSKADLKVDVKKPKHKLYADAKGVMINKFFVCVPSNLLDAAKEWVEKVNPKYGIIEFSLTKYENYARLSNKWQDMLYFTKQAKNLQDTYYTRHGGIAKRLNNIAIDKYLGYVKVPGSFTNG